MFDVCVCVWVGGCAFKSISSDSRLTCAPFEEKHKQKTHVPCLFCKYVNEILPSNAQSTEPAAS